MRVGRVRQGRWKDKRRQEGGLNIFQHDPAEEGTTKQKLPSYSALTSLRYASVGKCNYLKPEFHGAINIGTGHGMTGNGQCNELAFFQQGGKGKMKTSLIMWVDGATAA